MPKDNSFSEHERTLPPVEDKVGHLTPLQQFIKVCEATLECFAINGESSMNTSMTFLKVREYCYHASLK
jgi:hypothetical protein